MSPDAQEHDQHPKCPTPATDYGSADGADLIGAALTHLCRGLSADRSSPWPPPGSRQTKDLAEWARNMGLLLSDSELFPKFQRGGQEHDIYYDDVAGRVYKITRDGLFRLAPGIEIEAVSPHQDPRSFHLWEATPIEYLERLHLLNSLVPGLNLLEGIFDQENECAIITSQPRFDIVPVTEAEIERWFANLGFLKVTESGYYREQDNLGIFDAHSKNLTRAGDILVPFDVIPCRPKSGFLDFINDILSIGYTATELRKVSKTLSSPGPTTAHD